MGSARTRVRQRLRRRTAIVAGTGLLVAPLAACGVVGGAFGGDDAGPPTLVWYINPDVTNTEPFTADGTPGGQAYLALQCTEAAEGAYEIDVQMLPNNASDQREQLIRRLAAGDTSIDLMSLDPPFMPEAANAGFLDPVPEEYVDTFTEGVLDPAVTQATYDDTLMAAPFWANTQLLWFKKPVVGRTDLDLSRPVTWTQVIAAAKETETTVQVQGNRYEGYAVWINALVAGAGGAIVEDPEAGRDAEVTIDDEAGAEAARVIQELLDAGVANPSVSTAEEPQSLSGFAADDGGFMVNYPYVAADPATKELVANGELGWARYPRTVDGEESAPPLGGIDLAVSASSEHTDLAWKAAECLTSEQSQRDYMLYAGNPAARAAVYDDPKIREAYPMADLIRDSIDSAVPRPVTPYWTDISAAVVDRFHSPASVDPDSMPSRAAAYIEDVLQGEALL
jgi:multiple sugar transport system substrate-binding protein